MTKGKKNDSLFGCTGYGVSLFCIILSAEGRKYDRDRMEDTRSSFLALSSAEIRELYWLGKEEL